MNIRHSHETESMLSVGNEILSCRSFKDLERGILAPMTAYLDAETGCFLQITYDANAATQIGRNNCYNLSHSSHMEYVDHYFHEDPAIDVCRLPTREQIGVYSTSDYCDYTQFTKGILYNEFFRPNHMHHVLVMIMRADWRSSGWLALGFQRPPGSSAFGVVQKARAQRIAATAGSAIRCLLLQEAHDIRDQVVDQLETAHPETGVVFLDSHRTLIFGNAKGLKDLGLDGGDRSGNEQFTRVTSACQDLLVSRDWNKAVTVTLSVEDNLVATVRVRAIPSGDLTFVVYICGRRTEARLLRSCTELGMTGREIDIIRLLGTGLSNAEIAGFLFISPRTVENHLRAVYSKAGVNRRTQLLHRLMA